MDPVALHAFHETPPDLPLRVLLNAVAGLAATAVMNVPMNTLPEGTAPPFVAASVISGDAPFETDSRLANAVHYASGTLAGVLFTVIVVLFEAGLATGPNAADVPFTPLPVVPHALAGLSTYALLLAGFGYVVLPRYGPGEIHERVRHDWTISAAVYVAALLVLVPVLTIALV